MLFILTYSMLEVCDLTGFATLSNFQLWEYSRWLSQGDTVTHANFSSQPSGWYTRQNIPTSSPCSSTELCSGFISHSNISSRFLLNVCVKRGACLWLLFSLLRTKTYLAFLFGFRLSGSTSVTGERYLQSRTVRRDARSVPQTSAVVCSPPRLWNTRYVYYEQPQKYNYW